jgi:hypothetical protein
MERFNKKLTAFVFASWIAVLPLNAQDDPVRQGIEAFNAGQYQTALNWFEQADAAGVRGPALQYNIAVSLYRLNRFEEARARFLPLAQELEWHVLVTYNLGLVAEAQGNEAAALVYYRESAAQQEQEKIRTLAGQKLARLSPRDVATDTAAAAKRWLGVITFSGGHDSNASSLADDLLDNNASAEDEFVEALVYGQWYANGQARDGTKLYAMVFDRRFREFDYLDTQVFGAGIIHEKLLGGFQTETALRINNTQLNSVTVADQAQVTAGISRQYKPGTFGATYAYSNFDAGTNFRQTDGNQHRIDLSWNKRIDALTLQGRYRFENNKREDLRRNSGFASYSPQRDAVSISAHWQFTPQLNAGAMAEYIDSDYDGINILRDTDGSVVTATRHNSQQRLVFDASYRINSNWRVLSEYQHSDVDDTFALYTYDKNRLTATVEFQF